jgi:simple sugar transport system ATP-binding protein
VHALSSPNARPIITLENISKRFGSLWANREISLEVFEGEVHAVVGENGAGKSTLMKILYGHLQPDKGKVILQGRSVVFRYPREAMRAGIGMVHQQLLIFPQLTALENIMVGVEPKRWGWIKRREATEKVLQLCRTFGFQLPLDALAGELPYAHRQQIELLRVLYEGAKILILDEPTSLLAPPEVEQLLQLLKRLRTQGHTILFITHRLQEVFALTDRLSILRRGKWIATFMTSQTTQEEVARAIVSGETMSPANGEHREGEENRHKKGWQDSQTRPKKPLVVLENIVTHPSSHESGLENLSLDIQEGEILGIGCVVGNGERMLAQVLAGFISPQKGRLFFEGRDITRTSGDQRKQLGFQWLPVNPLEEALLPARTLWENCLLGSQRQSSYHFRGWLSKGRIEQWATEIMSAHEVKWSDLQDPLSALSGGNQQKVALARILSGHSRFVILEQPARGLDIQAQDRLCQHVRGLNASGVTFLLFSYDLDELFLLAHRIGILYGGRLMGIQPTQKARREELGRWMLGLADT